MKREPILNLLMLGLTGVILWSGLVTGGGVIEYLFIDTTISIIISVLLLNFVTIFITFVIIILGLLVVQAFFGSSSFLAVILQVIVAIGSLIPSIYLALTGLGKWLSFFPAYPENTRWVMSMIIGVVSLVAGLAQRKEQ